MVVKKIDTFRAGPFAFSSDFSSEGMNELVIEAKLLCDLINEIPLLPGIADNLKSELIIRSIMGTAAIKGNPLEEEEVGRIIEGLNISSGSSDRDIHIREIKNLKELYAELDRLEVGRRVVFSEDFIKQRQEIITKGIPHQYNIPGQYRNEPVSVGDERHGGIYRPPKAIDDIKNLMREFVSWMNSDEMLELDPILRASLGHYHLYLIHPFSDGNGRTARFIEAAILHSSGIKYVEKELSSYYYKNIDSYYRVFIETQQGRSYDMTRFVKFCLEGVITSAKRIKEEVLFRVRILTLQWLFKILREGKLLTARRHRLLEIISDYQQRQQQVYSFSIDDLYINPVFKTLYEKVTRRTTQRDLQNLSQTKFLNVEEAAAGKRYSLNLRKLG